MEIPPPPWVAEAQAFIDRAWASHVHQTQCTGHWAMSVCAGCGWSDPQHNGYAIVPLIDPTVIVRDRTAAPGSIGAAGTAPVLVGQRAGAGERP